LSGYVIPLSLGGVVLADGAFAVDNNAATAIGALVATIVAIWAIIRWVDSRIGEQVARLEAKTTVQLDHHHALVVGRLAAQDVVAAKNQELIIEKFKGLNDKLIQRHKP